MSEKSAGEVFNDLQQIANFIGKQSSLIRELEAENERLLAVYEAAKYARSAKVMTNTHLQKLDEALAKLEASDE